jgi:hypothetical protein
VSGHFERSGYNATHAALGHICRGDVRGCRRGDPWLPNVCSPGSLLWVQVVHAQPCEGCCVVRDLAGVLASVCCWIATPLLRRPPQLAASDRSQNGPTHPKARISKPTVWRVERRRFRRVGRWRRGRPHLQGKRRAPRKPVDVDACFWSTKPGRCYMRGRVSQYSGAP